MRTTIIAFSVAALAITCQAASARDLLAPSNLQRHITPVFASAQPVSIKQPFSTLIGKASYVCSISGLGHTSVCTVRDWAQRRSNFVEVAYR